MFDNFVVRGRRLAAFGLHEIHSPVGEKTSGRIVQDE